LERSIPDEVLHFIKECIDRIETLEVLLLLQSAPGRSWTAREVSDQMRSSRLAVQGALDGLHSRGLLEKHDDRFGFHPRRTDLADKTARLASCYRERRTAVITAIIARPNDAVRSFAEAFRFRKGGTDG